MSSLATPMRIDGHSMASHGERAQSTDDAAWKKEKETALANTLKRRERVEGLKRFGSGLNSVMLKTLLAGGTALLADEYVHDFMIDTTRDAILNVGTLALGAGLATSIGTNAAAEIMRGSDVPPDDAVEHTMKLNRFGMKQSVAKIGKWGGWALKMGALGVAGIATIEGLVGESLGDIVRDITPNLPGGEIVDPIFDAARNLSIDITPDMAYPAAGIAVAAHIGSKLYDTQDKIYDAANTFIQLDVTADGKSKDKSVKQEAADLSDAKKYLRENIGKGIWSKLLTGDILEGAWLSLQNQKFKYENRKGMGSATLSEFARKRDGKWENLITFLKEYNTIPLVAAGITGLLSPVLNGDIPDAIQAFDPTGAISAGVAISGMTKYLALDKPVADFYRAFKVAADRKIGTGRDKYVIGPV